MSKTILVAGKFNPNAVKVFEELCPEGFALDVFRDVNDKDTLSAKISTADYMFVRGGLPLDEAMLDQAKNLRLIQKWGVGYDSYDVELIGAKDIPFMNTAGGNAVQVSELTIGLLLALYRRILVAHTSLQQGKWLKEELLPQCHVISGKTVGVVGIGNIGRRVAALVKAFGATVQYYDAFPLSEEKEKELGVTRVDLDTLFATSDIVTLHLPLTPETKNMVNKDVFARMKNSAVLLNLGRGGLVHVEDLVNALETKQIAGAALDVLDIENEQYENHPLMHMDNVIVTPHMGASTEEVLQHQAELCYRNVIGVESGAYNEPKYFINGAYLKRFQK